jgi:hypothetical protein
MTLETVRLSPAALEKSQNKLLTMNIVDNFGFTKGRYEGRILRAAHGPRGAQLLCELMNVLTMTFKLPRKGVGNTPECKLSFSSSGASVRDVHGAISLLDSFRSGCKFELYAAGGRLATIGVDNVQDAPLVTDEWTRELVEDLYVIEQALHTVSFSVPDETTHLERIGIRIARLLLEGYQTVMPPGQAMSMTLNGEIDDALKLLLLEGSAVFATQPTTALEILGHKYDMGPGFVYHPRVKVIDGERIWKLLESGEGAGVKVKLAPIDDTPFRVWVQRDAKGRSEEHPPFRPWGVPGIGDPQIGDEPAPNAHP